MRRQVVEIRYDHCYFSVKDFMNINESAANDASRMFEMAHKKSENGGTSPCFASRVRPISDVHAPGMSPPTVTSQLEQTIERQFQRTLLAVSRTIERNEKRLAEQDRREMIRNEWQLVAVVVDRILLFVFIMTTVGITLCILLWAPHSWSFIFRTSVSDGVSPVSQTSSSNDSTEH